MPYMASFFGRDTGECFFRAGGWLRAPGQSGVEIHTLRCEPDANEYRLDLIFYDHNEPTNEDELRAYWEMHDRHI